MTITLIVVALVVGKGNSNNDNDMNECEIILNNFQTTTSQNANIESFEGRYGYSTTPMVWTNFPISIDDVNNNEVKLVVTDILNEGMSTTNVYEVEVRVRDTLGKYSLWVPSSFIITYICNPDFDI